MRNHHAECLLGPLAFLPPYARGSRMRYLRTRLVAKFVGFARVLIGRVVEPSYPMTRRERIRAYRLAFRRLLSIH